MIAEVVPQSARAAWTLATDARIDDPRCPSALLAAIAEIEQSHHADSGSSQETDNPWPCSMQEPLAAKRRPLAVLKRPQHSGARTVTRHLVARAVTVLKFAVMLRTLGGYAASWLLKHTAQAALSAGVPHGGLCEA